MSCSGKLSRFTPRPHAEKGRDDRAHFLVVEILPAALSSNAGQALVIAARRMRLGVRLHNGSDCRWWATPKVKRSQSMTVLGRSSASAQRRDAYARCMGNLRILLFGRCKWRRWRLSLSIVGYCADCRVEPTSRTIAKASR
jgi:hypothetical protein